MKPVIFGYDSFRAARYPCQCIAGECGCCTGFLLAQLNQKGCMNITYVPEDFTFKMKLSFNDRVLYKNRVSGAYFILKIFKFLFTNYKVILFQGKILHQCVFEYHEFDK